MLSLERILIDGTLLTVILGLIVLFSLAVKPRVWLGDYPEAIKKIAPPLTAEEKKARLILTAPLLVGFLVLPFILTRAFLNGSGNGANFLTVFLYTFAILNFFNLFDAVVLDWLFLGLLHPKFALIPEAWGQKALLLDKGKLVGDWIKGIGFCTVFGLIIAGAAMLSARF